YASGVGGSRIAAANSRIASSLWPAASRALPRLTCASMCRARATGAAASSRALPRSRPCASQPRFRGGRLARDDLIQIKGTITEALAGGNYRVKGDNGMEFLAKIGGRMRRYHLRVIPGDRVTVARPPDAPTHGLIVFRGG